MASLFQFAKPGTRCLFGLPTGLPQAPSLSTSISLSLSFSALAKNGGNWALLSLDSDRVRSVQHWFLQIAMKLTFYKRTHSAVSHILMLCKYEQTWIVNEVSEDRTMHSWKKKKKKSHIQWPFYKRRDPQKGQMCRKGPINYTCQYDYILMK